MASNKTPAIGHFDTGPARAASGYHPARAPRSLPLVVLACAFIKDTATAITDCGMGPSLISTLNSLSGSSPRGPYVSHASHSNGPLYAGGIGCSTAKQADGGVLFRVGAGCTGGGCLLRVLIGCLDCSLHFLHCSFISSCGGCSCRFRNEPRCWLHLLLLLLLTLLKIHMCLGANAPPISLENRSLVVFNCVLSRQRQQPGPSFLAPQYET